MIAGIFHKGSGLGNQLQRYVMARILALKKGLDFGMINADGFKGKSFLNLDMGKTTNYEYKIEEPAGKVVVLSDHVLWEEGKYEYNSGVKDVLNNTIIDGEFQDERYFKHHLWEIRKWLETERLELPDNLCIINFRGGEYVGVTDLFLPQEYWKTAMKYMAEKYPGIKFKVVTDDIAEAKKMFGPMMPVSHELSNDWRSIRYAKYLILSNSSFAILPALLGPAHEIIAPKFWGGRNVGQWRYPMNQYKRFTYL